MGRIAWLAFAWSAVLGVNAQSEIIGRWTTIDDNTHKPRSVVEITVKKGMLTGRIVDLYDKSKLKNLCDKCPGDRHDQPLIGLDEAVPVGLHAGPVHLGGEFSGLGALGLAHRRSPHHRKRPAVIAGLARVSSSVRHDIRHPIMPRRGVNDAGEDAVEPA